MNQKINHVILKPHCFYMCYLRIWVLTHTYELDMYTSGGWGNIFFNFTFPSVGRKKQGQRISTRFPQSINYTKWTCGFFYSTTCSIIEKPVFVCADFWLCPMPIIHFGKQMVYKSGRFYIYIGRGSSPNTVFHDFP